MLVGEVDLKVYPILLKDGDEIGIRLKSEAQDDDWQTEEDKLAEEAFKLANPGGK